MALDRTPRLFLYLSYQGLSSSRTGFVCEPTSTKEGGAPFPVTAVLTAPGMVGNQWMGL